MLKFQITFYRYVVLVAQVLSFFFILCMCFLFVCRNRFLIISKETSDSRLLSPFLTSFCFGAHFPIQSLQFFFLLSTLFIPVFFFFGFPLVLFYFFLYPFFSCLFVPFIFIHSFFLSVYGCEFFLFSSNHKI